MVQITQGIFFYQHSPQFDEPLASHASHASRHKPGAHLIEGAAPQAKRGTKHTPRCALRAFNINVLNDLLHRIKPGACGFWPYYHSFLSPLFLPPSLSYIITNNIEFKLERGTRVEEPFTLIVPQMGPILCMHRRTEISRKHQGVAYTIPSHLDMVMAYVSEDHFQTRYRFRQYTPLRLLGVLNFLNNKKNKMD